MIVDLTQFRMCPQCNEVKGCPVQPYNKDLQQRVKGHWRDRISMTSLQDGIVDRVNMVRDVPSIHVALTYVKHARTPLTPASPGIDSQRTLSSATRFPVNLLSHSEVRPGGNCTEE